MTRLAREFKEYIPTTHQRLLKYVVLHYEIFHFLLVNCTNKRGVLRWQTDVLHERDKNILRPLNSQESDELPELRLYKSADHIT